MKFSTKTIHMGWQPDQATGAVMPPIYMTSTFELDAPGQSRGFEYTRLNNPNFVFLEKILASL
ncbi:MAG: PLP-dependent transferase, partial [Parachlamydia sp.]|nr:PLP-dependent transferase [Parachlamydia sp.]